jgi:hypothetical protein
MKTGMLVSEMHFPNRDQRNKLVLLSKAKIKGLSANHSLIGRTHLGGKSTQIIFLTGDSLSSTKIGSHLGSQHSAASYCLE